LAENAAWERRRNAATARIKWMFTVDRASAKLARVYPQPASRAQTAA
ncbi:MAG TPA: IS630 family transposase, partial [Chloroflexota bacterium]|nr:IS630 family transposase [Chloroflexota bacterium]